MQKKASYSNVSSQLASYYSSYLNYLQDQLKKGTVTVSGNFYKDIPSWQWKLMNLKIQPTNSLPCLSLLAEIPRPSKRVSRIIIIGTQIVRFYQEVPSYHYFEIVSLIFYDLYSVLVFYQNIFDSLLQQKHKTSKQLKEKKTLELGS